MCIEKKREATSEFFDATEGKDDVFGHVEVITLFLCISWVYLSMFFIWWGTYYNNCRKSCCRSQVSLETWMKELIG